MLLDSFRRDADLTELGSKMQRFFVRNALVARLVSEAAWKQYPQHVDVADRAADLRHRVCRAPAPPRCTGCSPPTPRHQGLELWLAEFPQPRPPRETWSENPVFQQTRRAVQPRRTTENPDYTGLHYMTADEVEECWQLLRQSLHSVSYETLAHLPTYSQWLAQQDWTKSYQRHRKNLQLIGLNERREALGAEESQPPVRARRAVRDLPGRAGGAVPPARRDDHGVDVLAGAAHHRGLVEHVRRRRRSARTRWRPGRAVWSCSTPNAPKHDPAQFCDVDYFEFIKDPIVGRREASIEHVRHRLHRRGAAGDDRQCTPRARRVRGRRSTPTRSPTTG